MTDPGLRYALVGNVAYLTLDRPARLNALTVELLAALTQALDRAERDGSRAILITGAGRAFCSGADLVGAASVSLDDPASMMEDYFNPLARRLESFPVPVVMAVNGIAAGGGFSLAMLGDIVLMAESACLLASFVNIGLAPDFGATWTITRRVGLGRALEVMMLGDRISADLAVEWGLANRVVPDDDLFAVAEAMAARLAAGPTIALGLIRRAARLALVHDFDRTLADEVRTLRKTGRTEDAAHAIAAFSRHETVIFNGR